MFVCQKLISIFKMTGLDLVRDRILEIAAIVTEADLTPVDEGISCMSVSGSGHRLSIPGAELRSYTASRPINMC